MVLNIKFTVKSSRVQKNDNEFSIFGKQKFSFSIQKKREIFQYFLVRFYSESTIYSIDWALRLNLVYSVYINKMKTSSCDQRYGSKMLLTMKFIPRNSPYHSKIAFFLSFTWHRYICAYFIR